jgi:hypothetical protein
MAIGKKNKDQRSKVIQQGDGLVLAKTAISPQSDDPLVFWTNHPDENAMIDLNEFALGVHERPSVRSWNGPFTGRPQLIAELAPYVRKAVQGFAAKTVNHYSVSLRAWWRLFDAIEAQASSIQFTKQLGELGLSSLEVRVRGVADLSSLHGAMAGQIGMSANNFSPFKRLADAWRNDKGLLPLAWVSPERSDPVRSLPSQEQAKDLRHLIKSDWRAVLQTWEQKTALVDEANRRFAGEPPNSMNDESELRVQNALRYIEAQHRTGQELPDTESICAGISHTLLNQRGLLSTVMRSLLYPTAAEADIAFHMCTLASGWNPSTVGNLDASNPDLVRAHPKLSHRDVLESGERRDLAEGEGEFAEIHSAKPRARGALQYAEGKVGNDCSPPAVVRHYLARTGALRRELKRQLDVAALELNQLAAQNLAHGEQYQKKYLQVQTMREGVRCVWLFLGTEGAIRWLTGKRANRYNKWVQGKRFHESYMDLAIDRLNAERKRRGKAALASVTASDLRDLFAVWLHSKGGTLMQIMFALGHRRLMTTQNYLENNVFHEEADQQILRFYKVLPDQVREGRIDLTILAQQTRHGPITAEMMARLVEYRKMMKSRLHVACASPRTPPVTIAPEHVSGKLCAAQRCGLGCENARFLPESLGGLAMRLEELLVLSSHLPVETWIRGKYEDEMVELEGLLKLFDKEAVRQARQNWHERIHSGGHLIPEWGMVRPGMLEEAA